MQIATEWLAALEHAAHEFVFSESFPVVQHIAEATFEGHPPGGPEIVWCRQRESGAAHWHTSINGSGRSTLLDENGVQHVPLDGRHYQRPR